MPGGQFDSSTTRVASFFNQLLERDPSGRSWLPKLLTLPAGGSPPAELPSPGPLVEHAWWPEERALDPPPSLLSWLVRNLKCPSSMKEDQIRSAGRREPPHEAPDRVREALGLPETGPATRDWYVVEGPSYPDAYLATGDAVVVVADGGAEAAPTESTTERPVRHHVLRYLDAALGPAGPRSLRGFLMVEGTADGSIPQAWLDACTATLDPDVLRRSLPHRSPEERELIATSFLGVVTWRRACEELAVPPERPSEAVGG